MDDSYEVTIRDRSKISGKFPSTEFSFTLDDEDIQKIEQIIKETVDSRILNEAIDYNISRSDTITLVNSFDYKGDKVVDDRYYNFTFRVDFKNPNDLLSPIDKSQIPQSETILFNELDKQLSSIEIVDKSLLNSEQLQYFKLQTRRNCRKKLMLQ